MTVKSMIAHFELSQIGQWFRSARCDVTPDSAARDHEERLREAARRGDAGEFGEDVTDCSDDEFSAALRRRRF